MKGLAIISILIFAGCSSVPKSQPIELSTPDSSKPIHALVAETLINPPLPADAIDDKGPYLSATEGHRARLEKFVKNHPTWVEREKIVYLFESIKTSPYIFIRNGDKFNGDQAARFLRWKMGRSRYATNPIRTAKDFLERGCNRSSVSSMPYEVVFQDGSRHLLQEVLVRELAALEAALGKAAAQASMEKTSADYQKTQSEIQVPAFLPATPGSAK